MRPVDLTASAFLILQAAEQGSGLYTPPHYGARAVAETLARTGLMRPYRERTGGTCPGIDAFEITPAGLDMLAAARMFVGSIIPPSKRPRLAYGSRGPEPTVPRCPACEGTGASMAGVHIPGHGRPCEPCHGSGLTSGTLEIPTVRA